jgi:hypothetical protein
MKITLTAFILFLSCHIYAQCDSSTMVNNTNFQRPTLTSQLKYSEAIDQYLDSCIKSKNYSACFDAADIDSCFKAKNLDMDSGECVWIAINKMKAEISKDVAAMAAKITDPETQKAVVQADKAWNASIEKMIAADLKVYNDLNVGISRLLTVGYIYNLMKLRYENIKNGLDLYLLREVNKLAGY